MVRIRKLLNTFGLCVVMVMTLSSCTYMPKARDGRLLKPKQGLLAFHVTSNAHASLTYSGYSNVSTLGTRLVEHMIGPMGAFRFEAGKTFFLAPLLEGEYMFSQFFAYPKYAQLQASNRFTVKADTMTYIGHINVNVVNDLIGLRVTDRELEMRSYLADNYPKYFQTLGFRKSFAQLRLRD